MTMKEEVCSNSGLIGEDILEKVTFELSLDDEEKPALQTSWQH